MDFKTYYEQQKWDLATPFSRVNSLPIDRGCLFPSKDALQAYVDKNATNFAAALNTAINGSAYTSANLPINLTPYQGQYVAIIESETASAYVVSKVGNGTENSGVFKAMGGVENGDGKVKLVYDDSLNALKFVFN